LLHTSKVNCLGTSALALLAGASTDSPRAFGPVRGLDECRPKRPTRLSVEGVDAIQAPAEGVSLPTAPGRSLTNPCTRFRGCRRGRGRSRGATVGSTSRDCMRQAIVSTWPPLALALDEGERRAWPRIALVLPRAHGAPPRGKAVARRTPRRPRLTSSEPVLGQPAFGTRRASRGRMARREPPPDLPGWRRRGYDQNSSQA
jgi:hypothetical protein